MPMESQVKFCRQQNISRASSQKKQKKKNSIAVFS